MKKNWVSILFWSLVFMGILVWLAQLEQEKTDQLFVVNEKANLLNIASRILIISLFSGGITFVVIILFPVIKYHLWAIFVFLGAFGLVSSIAGIYSKQKYSKQTIIIKRS